MNLPYFLKYWKVWLAFKGWKLSGFFISFYQNYAGSRQKLQISGFQEHIFRSKNQLNLYENDFRLEI